MPSNEHFVSSRNAAPRPRNEQIPHWVLQQTRESIRSCATKHDTNHEQRIILTKTCAQFCRAYHSMEYSPNSIPSPKNSESHRPMFPNADVLLLPNDSNTVTIKRRHVNKTIQGLLNKDRVEGNSPI